jgi:hypothetical protein
MKSILDEFLGKEAQELLVKLDKYINSCMKLALEAEPDTGTGKSVKEQRDELNTLKASLNYRLDYIDNLLIDIDRIDQVNTLKIKYAK